jgi:hypothetical protein
MAVKSTAARQRSAVFAGFDSSDAARTFISSPEFKQLRRCGAYLA